MNFPGSNITLKINTPPGLVRDYAGKGEMILSDAGKILDYHLIGLSKNDDKIILDKSIIMPNHFHCTLIIPDYDFEYPIKPIIMKWTIFFC